VAVAALEVLGELDVVPEGLVVRYGRLVLVRREELGLEGLVVDRLVVNRDVVLAALLETVLVDGRHALLELGLVDRLVVRAAQRRAIRKRRAHEAENG
jgi:hypothetical protein